MASGRVGGTRSKIRGQVGDIIYQVVKNADGTYTQTSYGKPEDVTQTITPRLQAQRMCTSMVEALMRDLAPIGKICMQSAANKSKSLNAFSSYNLQIVARDCKENWYENNHFYFPTTANIGSPAEQLGGRFMLSSGTWQYNGFDSLVHVTNMYDILPFAQYVGKRFCGMRFDLMVGNETVQGFLNRHFMSSLDMLCFAALHSEIDFENNPEDPQFTTKHSWLKAQVVSTIDPNSWISESVLDQLFECESDIEVFRAMSNDRRAYFIGFMIDNENLNAYFHTYGGFTISYLEGKKKISSSTMTLIPDEDVNYFVGSAPADVFGTWMGEPNVKPYPSPF